MLQEHLLDKKNYALISDIQAHNLMEEFIFEVSELINFDHVNDLTDNERIFFARGLDKMQRIPQMYGNPKVHKKWTIHVPLRPVNSQVGSFPAVVSKFVDYYLKKLIPFIPGNVKNSLEVIERLKEIDFNQPHIWLAMSDAVAMYPNIKNEEGIAACEKYFELYSKECECFFPSELLVKLLTLIITKNVFKFGDTSWIQKDGTAIGTPCACNYATIVFAYYERTSILPKFKNHLLIYLRFIDDIFIVWKDSTSSSTSAQILFQFV